MPSLFSRLTRYTPTEGRIAKEDMLTEAFAVTLEADHDLARSSRSGGSFATSSKVARLGAPWSR